MAVGRSGAARKSRRYTIEYAWIPAKVTQTVSLLQTAVFFFSQRSRARSAMGESGLFKPGSMRRYQSMHAPSRLGSNIKDQSVQIYFNFSSGDTRYQILFTSAVLGRGVCQARAYWWEAARLTHAPHTPRRLPRTEYSEDSKEKTVGLPQCLFSFSKIMDMLYKCCTNTRPSVGNAEINNMYLLD